MKIQEAKAYFEKLCVENHVKLVVPIRENARLRWEELNSLMMLLMEFTSQQ